MFDPLWFIYLPSCVYEYIQRTLDNVHYKSHVHTPLHVCVAMQWPEHFSLLVLCVGRWVQLVLFSQTSISYTRLDREWSAAYQAGARLPRVGGVT